VHGARNGLPRQRQPAELGHISRALRRYDSVYLARRYDEGAPPGPPQHENVANAPQLTRGCRRPWGGGA
jgi:hypothetical protein